MHSPNLSKFQQYILNTSNFYAAGTNADEEWNALGCSGQLPIQPDIQGHWDEACLVDELMSPLATGNQALSRMTIGALEDIGYTVNYNEADEYTINDLNANGCGTSCPEAPGGRRLRSYENKRHLLTEAEMTGIKISFKDDLLYFHDQLKQTGFGQGEGGLHALEQIDVLFIGSDGERHDLTITYDDIKDM
jgi:hypothetical protein